MVENYTKDLKESVYQGAVVSILALCFMLYPLLYPPQALIYAIFQNN